MIGAALVPGEQVRPPFPGGLWAGEQREGIWGLSGGGSGSGRVLQSQKGYRFGMNVHLHLVLAPLSLNAL